VKKIKLQPTDTIESPEEIEELERASASVLGGPIVLDGPAVDCECPKCKGACGRPATIDAEDGTPLCELCQSGGAVARGEKCGYLLAEEDLAEWEEESARRKRGPTVGKVSGKG
jgi:hypothetical protein